MAELTPLFMDISNVYSGDDLGLPWRDVMGEGVVGSGDLAVTQRASGADLSVDVAAGAAWVVGDTNPALQPCYRVYNDATVNLGITPDPSNPRIVSVVAQITDESFAGVGRQWNLVAIHGTPAASPSAPALPGSALLLANVTVPAAAASVVTADIADKRVRAKIGGGSVLGPGAEIAYDEAAPGLITVSVSSPATALTVVAGSSHSYDGTPVMVEGYCPAATPPNGATGYGLVLGLFEGSTLINYTELENPAASDSYLAPLLLRTRITPSRGNHTYSLNAYVSAGTGYLTGGSDAGGQWSPTFLRITKV